MKMTAINRKKEAAANAFAGLDISVFGVVT